MHKARKKQRQKTKQTKKQIKTRKVGFFMTRKSHFCEFRCRMATLELFASLTCLSEFTIPWLQPWLGIPSFGTPAWEAIALGTSSWLYPLLLSLLNLRKNQGSSFLAKETVSWAQPSTSSAPTMHIVFCKTRWWDTGIHWNVYLLVKNAEHSNSKHWEKSA